MFAIVDIGGKQYKAEVGRELVVDRLDAPEGEVVQFRTVLVSGDDGTLLPGDEPTPAVTAHVVEHLKGPKLTVFKFKPKRGFARKNGFRSALTRIAVDKIG